MISLTGMVRALISSVQINRISLNFPFDFNSHCYYDNIVNIFILDYDIQRACEYHTDKHCSKMVLETAQLLCSPYPQGSAPYKRTHYNHPCAVWTRHSIENFKWLVNFGLTLAREKEYRFNKPHKSQQVIQWCSDNLPDLPVIPMSPFPLAMPDEYKQEDVVLAYQQYYFKEKAHLFKWTKREVPGFINNLRNISY